MNKNNTNFFLAVLALVIAVAGIIICRQFLIPSISENLAKISAYNYDIAKVEEKLDSISTAEKSMTKLSDLVNNFLIAVPDSVDAPNLITEIETIAAQNQLALPSLAPPSGINATSDISVEGMEVSMSVTGSFQNINNFISSLENSIRFLKISGLTITSSNDGSLSASITCEVYKRPKSTLSGITN